MQGTSRSGRRFARAILRARLVDAKFRHNKRRYFLQTLLAVLTVMVVLLLLDSVTHTVLVASLGASAFIAFAMPRNFRSRPRYMIGGYLVGTIVGCSLSGMVAILAFGIGMEIRMVQLICGAIATGLTFFLMVVTDTEHPPAAALSLGYVLNQWDWGTVAVVLLGISALVAVKQVFRRQLMDLV